MDVWGWILVYAVGLALLQVLVYRYLWQQGGSLAGEAPFSSDTRPDESRRPRPRDALPTREADSWLDMHREEEQEPAGSAIRRCPNCGADNELDQTYTYCWNCVTRIEGE
jgi:hypothetical protein